MHTGRIIGATRVLGAPKNWDRKIDGPCGSLAIRDEETTAGIGMTSAWFPNTEEIKRIVSGAPIHLTIVGGMHPPVSMSVGAPPDENLESAK